MCAVVLFLTDDAAVVSSKARTLETKKFSKVSGPVHLLYKDTIWYAFQNVYLEGSLGLSALTTICIHIHAHRAL